MEDGADVAWLASYALGLAAAGRQDAAAIADLAEQAGGVDACCCAIDRLARCGVGSLSDRQRAMDLLSRAAAMPCLAGDHEDEYDGLIDVSDAASDVGLRAVSEVDLQRLS